jgi:hypothetical protein
MKPTATTPAHLRTSPAAAVGCSAVASSRRIAEIRLRPPEEAGGGRPASALEEAGGDPIVAAPEANAGDPPAPAQAASEATVGDPPAQAAPEEAGRGPSRGRARGRGGGIAPRDRTRGVRQRSTP